MQTPHRVSVALALVTTFACAHPGPEATDERPHTQARDDHDDERGEPPERCAGVGTSNLQGVCIWLPEARGTWTLAEAAAGISIPYVVIVEDEIADVIVAAQDGGNCSSPGPSGLIVFERLSGDDQQYCLCDSGLCAGPGSTPVTIPPGRTPASFEWTGHNWYGPSDTNNPLGPAFAPGSYVLELSARGTVGGAPFEVRNHFTVNLTP